MQDAPGMMVFYDDWLELVEDYSVDEIGLLFIAALKYGALDEATDFEDRSLRIAFRRITHSIDYDRTRYENKVKQRAYAAYAKREKKAGNNPLTFEEWLTTDNDR